MQASGWVIYWVVMAENKYCFHKFLKTYKLTFMKKIFLCIAVYCCVANTAGAQKITFGINAGLVSANTFIKADSEKVGGMGSRNEFTGGVAVTVPISKYFSFQPGVNFLQKGFKNDESATTLTLNYIEVPLNILFNTHNNITDKKTDDFFFGIGPSFAFGTSGQFKLKTDSGTFKENIKFGSSKNDNLKPFDCGANVVIGCQFFNNIFFSFNYNIGLSNLTDEKEVRWRNNYLGFRAGYTFGGNKK